VPKKSKRKSKGLDLTKPIERPRMPFAVLFRMFVLGSISIVASGYAIYRHYYVARPPMLMPRPTATASADETEPLPPGFVPVPELVPLPPASGAPSTAPSR
jgi:hypothetical protein